MKMITIDQSKCVGCRNCEMACAYSRTKETCESKESNIKITHYIDDRIIIPMTCLHCEEAWCMSVCPANAISRDEKTNAVVIDKNRCAGCKMCILSCPYGNIHFDSEELVSRKCTLCGGNPKCVGHCISGALKYEEIDDAVISKRKKVDSRLKDVFKLNSDRGEK